METKNKLETKMIFTIEEITDFGYRLNCKETFLEETNVYPLYFSYSKKEIEKLKKECETGERTRHNIHWLADNYNNHIIDLMKQLVNSPKA